MGQCSRIECVEISGTDTIEYHKQFAGRTRHISFWKKKGVELDVLDIVECHRIGDSERLIVVLLKNRRDCKKILEKKTNKRKNVKI